MDTRARVEIGPLTLLETGERRDVEGETTTKGVRADGVARVFDVTGPDVDVEIADVTWVNRSRDVRMLNRREVKPLDRLVRGLRIGVHPSRDDRWYVELRIPALGPRMVPTQHKTNLDELDERCGFDVRQLLVGAGAVAVNPRALAIGDAGPRRNELCAVFRGEDSSLPAVAYAITPLLTYWKLFGSNAPTN
jgi:hypothetical protein